MEAMNFKGEQTYKRSGHHNTTKGRMCDISDNCDLGRMGKKICSVYTCMGPVGMT